MDEDAAGNSDHLLAAQGSLRDDGGVLPGRRLVVVAGNGADACFIAGKRLTVIFLLSGTGPDGQGRFVHDQFAGNKLDRREVSVHVFAGRIGDGVGRDYVVAAAGIGLGTGAGNGDVEVAGQAIDQGIRRTHQGRAVIELTGGLGDEGDLAGIIPLAVGRIEFIAFQIT